MDDSRIEDEDMDEQEQRLIANGVLIPPKDPSAIGRTFPAPVGSMISNEVMEQIWREERDGR